jgi:hypothetical protein
MRRRILEEQAAKKEAHRQAARAHKQRKAQENQRSVDSQPDIDIVEEIEAADNGPELEPDPVRAHSAFLIRADGAARAAFYTRGKIDAQVVAAAEETAACWNNLVTALKGGRYVQEKWGAP